MNWRREGERDTGERLSEAQLRQAADYTIGRLLESIYPMPDGMEHERDYLRLVHADLGTISDLELADERARARLRLMLDPRPEPWLIERVRLLEENRAHAR